MKKLALALALVLVGCVSGGHPRWVNGVFYAPWDQYRIRPLPGATGPTIANRLLGPLWRGVPSRRGPTRSGGPPPDLHFENERDGALVMVETIPLAPDVVGRDLRYLADGIVSQLAIEVGRRSTPYGARPVIPPVRAITATPATVGGAEAFSSSYDFGPGTDGIQLVLVRAAPDRTYHPDEPGRRDGRATVVLFALIARPEVYAQHLAELDAMLARVDFRSL